MRLPLPARVRQTASELANCDDVTARCRYVRRTSGWDREKRWRARRVSSGRTVRNEPVVTGVIDDKADRRRRQRHGWRHNRGRTETREMTDEAMMVAAIAVHRRDWRRRRIAAQAGGQGGRREVVVMGLTDIALQGDGENQQAGSQQPADIQIVDVSRPARHLHVKPPLPAQRSVARSGIRDFIPAVKIHYNICGRPDCDYPVTAYRFTTA